ncbi:hypothetical protein VNO78_24361 [Psophocarpus tetragonolobus]|uniref:Uncharacterized protein n=1 Tax=Psophocarpus tetragonolobus TaxID=3891 RepID=A0AAN9S846_PSOTE
MKRVYHTVQVRDWRRLSWKVATIKSRKTGYKGCTHVGRLCMMGCTLGEEWMGRTGESSMRVAQPRIMKLGCEREMDKGDRNDLGWDREVGPNQSCGYGSKRLDQID